MKYLRKIKSIIGILLIALLCTTCWVVPLAAADQAVPSPTREFYVLDQADVLSTETESKIINTSQELARKTKAQVVVVTVNSLGDEALEEYALAILRKWEIGDKELNNGVLLLVVPPERQARIEVGYGLEGALPDAKTGRIQDEYMIPHFQEGDYNQGILNGYLALVQETAKEYEVEIDLETTARPVRVNTPADKPLPSWVSLLGVIVVAVLLYLDYRYMNGFFLSLILSIIFRGGRGGGGGFGGGGGGGFGGGGSGGGGGSSRNW